MSPDSQAAVIVNDLDSLVHRIRALPFHPDYEAAIEFVSNAKLGVDHARKDLERMADLGRLFPKSA